MPAHDATEQARLSAAETALAAEVERRGDELRRWASFVWDHPELAYQEHQAAAHFVKVIGAARGFTVATEAAGLPTAFAAQSEAMAPPTVAFLAEYDALPGLSNVPEPRQAPQVAGGAGHGCHHHLLGAASVLAGLALQGQLAQAAEAPAGQVRIIGCPAEERDGAKIPMLSAGVFDGVDFVVAWHPASRTHPCHAGNQALICLTVSFFGLASHAAMAPHAGRSALDAALLFAHGLEFLREHIPDGSRIHYVVTRGGAQPNIVPDAAEVEVYLRARRIDAAEQLLWRLSEVARGADRMAWTDWYGDRSAGYRAPELTVQSAYWPMLPNRAGTEALQQVLAALGPIAFGEQDQSAARALQRVFGVSTDGLDGSAVGVPDEGAAAGSSDVGDVSWNVPLVELNAATLPTSIPVHSWAAVAAGKESFAVKGAVRAAQAMAILGHRFLSDASLRHRIARDFEATTSGVRWRSLAGTKLTLGP